MADTDRAQVLVVGASTTGLTMACELARHGAAVRIIDRLPAALPFARASGIHSRTLEVFQDLGVVDAILAEGQPIRAVNQFANGERFLRAENAEIESPYPFTIGLEQWKTEAILERRLGRLGVAVERNTEFVELDERIDGVVATLKHADGRLERVHTPWLVGCDGAHSRVRHVNRQHFPGEADPHRFIVADLVFDGELVHDEAYMFFTDEGVLWRFPMPEGRSLILADTTEPTASADDAPDPVVVHDIVRSRAAVPVRITDVRWLSWFRIHYRLTPHYRHGRTFLVGDAAHIHSPVSGQGMNTGIQDAYNLAWKLAGVFAGRSPESLLDSYEKERRAVAEGVLAQTRAMTEQAEAFASLAEHDRDRLFRNVQLPEAERLRSALEIEELDLDYRRSPISTDHPGHHRRGGQSADDLHAGAQARDVFPLDVEGRRTSLFELLAGPRPVLLLIEGRDVSSRDADMLTGIAREADRAHGERLRIFLVTRSISTHTEPTHTEGPRSPITIVRDVDGALQARYDAERPRLYLIRPDGYIGLRSQPPSLPVLRDYLAAILRGP